MTLTTWRLQVTFDDGAVRWLVELTNGLLGKWTTAPYGAKVFDVEGDAQATAQNLRLRTDVQGVVVEAFEEELVIEAPAEENVSVDTE